AVMAGDITNSAVGGLALTQKAWLGMIRGWYPVSSHAAARRWPRSAQCRQQSAGGRRLSAALCRVSD
ncbi:hypothetical protein BaRGS_00039562, partial [Batillaria attramentaria]